VEYSPHPAISKREGSEDAFKVLSFAEDLGEAKSVNYINQL
jgi:hypothetical protein